ncbi:effector-associated constant component EACC1 [Streptomyces syringium]|uniref:effector-associated constant component EACC1 n=1 Tax=Streptomyces syringium TaxID=76729 RepID=UPI003AAD460D
MSITQESRARYQISIIDDDPLRARREARELLGEIVGADSTAALDTPRQEAPSGTDKGADILDTIGLVFSAGSLVAASVQVWLARVPQRTIVATRPDGSTLRITGREARTDDERIERFLAGGEGGHSTDDGDGTGGSVG